MPTDSGSRFDGPSAETAHRLDDVFDLLTNRRRRTLLRILAEREDDSVDCSSLATEIVEREARDYTIERDVVLLELHHKHLPKLAESGAVDYDPQDGVVRYSADGMIESRLGQSTEEG